jgi:alpha-N-arabinofuranosidase
MRSTLRNVLLLCIAGASAAVADTRIDIDVDHPGPTIDRHIYGQFMEHLGRGIYEGIWVGDDSDIPNVDGYRLDVVDALKDLHVPVLRWPGGCFADEYHWRDGIGPREDRPRRVNTNWGGVIDDNAFGTHEFLNFAELIGADAYVNGNLGTGSPAEMAQWLEYMTSPGDGTLARLRRRNGRDEPWRVAYFAIGNESWGCGGHMTPAYYSDLYKHYATFLKTPSDNTPELIASGGNDSRTDWTDSLISNVSGVRMNAISHHYYTIPSGVWRRKGRALEFDEDQWFSTLSRTLLIEDYIDRNVAILDARDPRKRVGFYLDEWGAWYDPEPGDNPGFLFQQNSLRDALLASLNFDIFHRHAERIRMTNIAQMINVLQAMILTDKEKMLLTPTYHVFRMYVPFQDAAFMPLTVDSDEPYSFGGDSIPRIGATSGRGQDGRLYVAVTNTDPNEPEGVTITTGQRLSRASGQVLTADAMDAHNTFEHPNAVHPEALRVSAVDGAIHLTMPPKSVTVLALE